MMEEKEREEAGALQINAIPEPRYFPRFLYTT